MVTVIQSVYGDYDELEPWTAQTVEYQRLHIWDSRNHLHPRMAAKVAKCEPWRYTNDDIVIWVDGNIAPTDDRFIEHLVDSSKGPISQYRHPHRDCIQDEAKVSAGMVKYQGQRVIEQAAHYMDQGHPPHWGLWATGIILYRPEYISPYFGRAWLAEQCVWTIQDQISQPYLLNCWAIEPTTIPGDIFNMEHATIRPHTHDQ